MADLLSKSRLQSQILKKLTTQLIYSRSYSKVMLKNTFRKSLTLCHRQLIFNSRQSLCQKASIPSFVEQLPAPQKVDPYKIVEEELRSLSTNIKKEIQTSNVDLASIAEYYFDGKGKSFRPMLVMLMAKALNFHVTGEQRLLECQQQVAMIAEMIHTASLMHDDVIDHADTRRGKASINQTWGQRKSILAGDYVMSRASVALANIGNEEVVSIVSQITEDLVKGEFMQLGSKEKENERFSHYLTKTFKKTASLLANSCQAVAVLGGCGEELVSAAYEYGRNIGISFQLIDDLLDFTSCDDVMGKPTAADLRLGLATAPVLFAASTHPELSAMIMRRFSQPGDVERARDCVAKSDGVAETRRLAEQHSRQAVHVIQAFRPSNSLRALDLISHMVLTRNK